MRAGKLRHRVEVQQPAEVQTGAAAGVGSYNEAEPDWTTVKTRWAEVMPLSGRKLEIARQIQPDVTHEVTMRYDPGLTVTPKQRLKFGGRILWIREVRNTGERGREWVLSVTENVGYENQP